MGAIVQTRFGAVGLFTTPARHSAVQGCHWVSCRLHKGNVIISQTTIERLSASLIVKLLILVSGCPLNHQASLDILSAHVDRLLSRVVKGAQTVIFA